MSEIMPYSMEAEKQVIGMILIDSDLIERVADVLEPDEFYILRHQRFVAFVFERNRKGLPCDPLSLAEVWAAGAPEQIAEADYFLSMPLDVATTFELDKYIRQVKDKAVERSLKRAAHQVLALVDEQDRSVEEKCSLSGQLFFGISEKRIQGGLTKVSEGAKWECERLVRQMRGEIAPGLPTGFDVVDKVLGGLQPGLYIVAARPGMGKTSFALQVAGYSAMTMQLPTIVFSLEMSTDQLSQRLLSTMARVSVPDLRNGSCDEGALAAIRTAYDELQEAPLWIDDTPGISTFKMLSEARSLASREGQLGLIVVDYLQLARSSSRTGNRVEEVSAIARELVELSKHMNCPVLALAQLSRAVEQREDKRPMLSDLRESGSIEAEADAVAFIYRPSYYRQKKDIPQAQQWGVLEPEDTNAEIIVSKHRHGPTATVELNFEAEYTRFYSKPTY